MNEVRFPTEGAEATERHRPPHCTRVKIGCLPFKGEDEVKYYFLNEPNTHTHKLFGKLARYL